MLAGVSVHEDRVREVATHVDDVATSYFGPGLRTGETEFHGVDLRSGHGVWKGVAPSKRIEIYRAVLEPLGWDGVFVSYAAIDKRRYRLRGDDRLPHVWALQFLVEKLNAHCLRIAATTLLVADETSEHEQFALDLLLELQRGNASRGLSLGQVTNVVDTVHFVRSETNRGVQLADMVAYLIGRVMRTAATPAESAIYDDFIRRNVRTFRTSWP